MPEKKEVTIYTSPTCHWCDKAKEYMKAHKIVFKEVNARADKAAAEYIMKKTGQMGVPVIEIGKKILVGFDEDELAEALGI